MYPWDLVLDLPPDPSTFRAKISTVSNPKIWITIKMKSVVSSVAGPIYPPNFVEMFVRYSADRKTRKRATMI